MKKVSNPYIYYIFLFISTIVLSSCYTGQRTSSARAPESPNDTILIQSPISLADFLRRAPGVTFTGNEVSIRGGGPPLYIVDGVWVGHSYQSAATAVSVQDIASVEVLSRPSEIAMYGRRGGNGVVIIHTIGADPNAGRY